MVRDISLSRPDWYELVFNGKNKAYGAYVLRKESTKRHLLAYLSVILFTAIVMLLPKALNSLAPAKVHDPTLGKAEFIAIVMPEVKDEHKIIVPHPPTPPNVKTSVKFTIPIVKEDDLVRDGEEMKTQSELNQSRHTISVADVIGNEDGDDIADLPDHMVIMGGTTEQVIDIAEIMPAFPGGEQAMRKWMNKTLKYPEVAQEMQIEGRVFIQFIVGVDGTIRNAAIIGAVDPLLDNEALRMVKDMPKWIPGSQQGSPVAVRFTIPVTFKLQR